MARPQLMTARARAAVRYPHAPIRVLIAVVFLVLAAAVLLIGGVQ
ncbi:hypothetical protein SAMN04489713_11670 [Actinomadura madurae]|uniref:Uncharacterized protein n=1 Tax=Actinomadura madurae TaxID=1993 RepID=A0A1I5S7T9_9ACTN|nr:hypothetical protein [Actinomadura madurae]SFP66868.1 hypothetical protein SAMN04489713_11670 [Actinomadura madurae]